MYAAAQRREDYLDFAATFRTFGVVNVKVNEYDWTEGLDLGAFSSTETLMITNVRIAVVCLLSQCCQIVIDQTILRKQDIFVD